MIQKELVDLIKQMVLSIEQLKEWIEEEKTRATEVPDNGQSLSFLLEIYNGGITRLALLTQMLIRTEEMDGAQQGQFRGACLDTIDQGRQFVEMINRWISS